MEQVKPDKRSLVLSRSTFPGTGRYAGHALGKNKAGWDEMYRSLVAVMDFNLFGIPYVGPNTCGYYDDSSMELCIRWTQMAAFFPIFRTYKGRGTDAADPASLGSEFIESIREASSIVTCTGSYLTSILSSITPDWMGGQWLDQSSMSKYCIHP
eukprot:XP_011665039.1 PREDICTED: putative maltase-glucoamylase-like protein FLJ16351 [Strongylocentrotus purpuratus]